MKKVLFFGDAVGKPGRKALIKIVPELRKEYQPDFVVANVENLAHGKGVTVKSMRELDNLGIDAFTSGNHVFDKGELTREAFETFPNLIRPANYGQSYPGKGFVRIEKDGQGYLIVNLNAQVFFEKQFPTPIANPFFEFDQIISNEKRPEDIVLVDFHSEATSEKRAFGFYADGRAAMVYGTHTHVPTADWQILPQGTAFVSDVGMIGAKNSVLGVPIENSLGIFLQGKFVYEIEESNPVIVNAVYAEIEDGRATKIEKISREIEV